MSNHSADKSTCEGEAGEPAGSGEGREGIEPPEAPVRRSGVRVRPPGTSPPAARPARTYASIVDVYDAHEDFVWSILARSRVEDAEGIHQEVFVQMYLYIQDNPMPDDVRAMLRTITRRAIGKDVRYLSRHPRTDAEVDADAVPESWQDPEKLLDAARMTQMTRDIVEQLPAGPRAVIQDIDLDEKEPEAVARSLQRSPATLRVQLMRARKAFQRVAERLYRRRPGGDQ